MNSRGKPAERLNILFIASEADPLVKAGGLGDVAGALPVAIQHLNQGTTNLTIDTRLAIPFYNHIRLKNLPTEPLTSFFVDTLTGPVKATVFSIKIEDVVTYLVAGEPISRSDTTYGTDFKADAEKFIFFSLACLKIPSALQWDCDILHANDWHTAVAVHQLSSIQRKDRYLKSTRSVLTVHNLPFMGTGAEEALKLYQVKPAGNQALPQWAKTLPLPMGLAAADSIIAVSPTYSREILTPEFGCDLQDFLITRKEHLSGILNGIDVNSWNPEKDPEIASNFEKNTIAVRKDNKAALLKEFHFNHAQNIPLLVLISRMDRQKGVDILIEGLRAAKDLPWRVILLGTGDRNLEQACKDLEEEMPDKVRAAILFDTALSRRMYAGADILLMPSRYEPCGLSQMYAMRYGCLPLARATGGLVDTVFDADTSPAPTGFLFPDATAHSFHGALLRALSHYRNQEEWRQMQLNGMTQDFSWTLSANNYLDLYTQLHNPY